MKRESIRNFFKNKTTRIVLSLLIALLLIIAVYCVFFRGEKTVSKGYEATELEVRLSAILSEIEGVERASVMIGEEDGKTVSAIIVFKGNDGILTRMRVVNAASVALGIPKENIQVYPAES